VGQWPLQIVQNLTDITQIVHARAMSDRTGPQKAQQRPIRQAVRSPVLDDVDLALLAELIDNGRLTNAALAERVGIAESTCSQRLRALRSTGAIRRFHAEVDPAALGLALEAVITVRLANHSHDQVHAFQERLRSIPNVIRIFHVAGADDYLLHVAVESAAALRDLVLEHIQVHPGVRHTETQLVFEVIDGAGLLPRR
jgi:DNA-binding Lrp family transcriptional regulator